MDKFKGLTIELISKADIKYKGILQDIDSVNSEITLTKVKCLGSELKGIAESARIFESIRFKSSDIKDLVIDEKVEQQTVAAPKSETRPSRQQSKIIDMDEDDEDNVPFEKPKQRHRSRSPVRKEPKKYSQQVQNTNEIVDQEIEQTTLQEQRDSDSESIDRNNKSSRPTRGRATRSNRSRGGRGRGRGRGSNKQHIPKEDFDFASNIDKFNQMSLEDKEEDKVEKAYDKQSSFFDSLSNERATINRNEERQMNMETFGTARVYRPRRRGGNRRGGYRGSRGGDSTRGTAAENK